MLIQCTMLTLLRTRTTRSLTRVYDTNPGRIRFCVMTVPEQRELAECGTVAAPCHEAVGPDVDRVETHLSMTYVIVGEVAQTTRGAPTTRPCLGGRMRILNASLSGTNRECCDLLDAQIFWASSLLGWLAEWTPIRGDTRLTRCGSPDDCLSNGHLDCGASRKHMASAALPHCYLWETYYSC